jgi:GcrA cell cycle regulator
MSGEWTPTRISALIALWTEGLSTSEIGHRLGITKNAVVGKVHRLGLPKRHTSSARKAAEAIEPSTVIRLEGLKAGMCSWPDGEPGTEGFRFCGEPAIEGRPYCAAHCERAYVHPSKDKKEKTQAA